VRRVACYGTKRRDRFTLNPYVMGIHFHQNTHSSSLLKVSPAGAVYLKITSQVRVKRFFEMNPEAKSSRPARQLVVDAKLIVSD
jgi:hypothetical protein